MTDKINKYAEYMTKQTREGSFGYPSKSGKQGVGVDARGPVEDAAVSLDESKKVPGGSKHFPESEEIKFSDYVAWIAEGNITPDMVKASQRRSAAIKARKADTGKFGKESTKRFVKNVSDAKVGELDLDDKNK